MRVTGETLKELGATDIPIIYVMNKVDKCDDTGEIPRIHDDRIYMSAGNMLGIPELLEMIKDRIYAGNREVSLLIPYDKGALVNLLNENAKIISQEYRENGVFVKADVTEALYGRVKEYEI